ncbi:MAG: hypothetical protein ABI476_09510, partial [Oxalobacteraceae bacterium]
MWRRFRHGADHPGKNSAPDSAQDVRQDSTQNSTQNQRRIATLMHRVNPDARWQERANWLMDVAEWLRHKPKVTLQDDAAWRNIKNQRLLLLLDWLDAHRDARHLVQLTLQKSLREAAGPELFCATGLPGKQAFIGELFEHLITRL